MRTKFTDRYHIYSKMLNFMIKQNCRYLPTPLEDICNNLDIELVPMSKIIAGGRLTETQIYEAWRNQNGHLMQWTNKNGLRKFKIAYNDSLAHKDRKNFTIAEEITHYVLKHYEDKMYDLLSPAPWDEELYQFHEESARIGAGILVCPPPIFYELPSLCSVDNIKYLCDISRSCANTRHDIMSKYKYEIEKHPFCALLSKNYKSYIDTLMVDLPCYLCGDSPSMLSSGKCPCCEYTLEKKYDSYNCS